MLTEILLALMICMRSPMNFAAKKMINTTINIANPENYSVPFIISSIEEHLHKKAICNEIEKGDNYNIDISLIEPIIQKVEYSFQ